ncbi:MAG: hypothetical protein Q9208_005540 [Pyrenodesmia sp. 3 TL-2023]
MVNPELGVDENGAFDMAFPEMTIPRLQDHISFPSTLGRCMSILNLANDDKDLNGEYGADWLDAQVRSAVAFELMGRKRFLGAYKLLYSIVKQSETDDNHYGIELLPAVIEFIKCCNLLNRAREGEATALSVLNQHADLLAGQQLCNLQIVLVDSLIAQKKYKRAEETLLEAMQNDHSSAYLRGIANLRLNKIKRRLGSLTNLELFTGLSEIDINLHDSSMAAAVKDEYFDELSATISCPISLQALLAASEDSVRAIHSILLDPNARRDSIALTQIARHAKDTVGRRSSIELAYQNTTHVIQDRQTASLSALYHMSFRTSSEAVQPKPGNMSKASESPRRPKKGVGNCLSRWSLPNSLDRQQKALQELQEQDEWLQEQDEWLQEQDELLLKHNESLQNIINRFKRG